MARVTRRVTGPIYVQCPKCRRRLGPFSRLTTGMAGCAHCGARFRVTA